MQKVKTIQIGPRSFTLKELPVRLIWELINNDQSTAKVSMLDHCQNLLKLACPELTQEVLLELYPSEIEELWTAFEEVNAAFLGVVRRIGLFDILIDGIKPIMAAEFKIATAAHRTLTGKSVASLPPATDPESGNTAMASS